MSRYLDPKGQGISYSVSVLARNVGALLCANFIPSRPLVHLLSRKVPQDSPQTNIAPSFYK
jgi:hypothetical protein